MGGVFKATSKRDVADGLFRCLEKMPRKLQPPRHKPFPGRHPIDFLKFSLKRRQTSSAQPCVFGKAHVAHEELFHDGSYWDLSTGIDRRKVISQFLVLRRGEDIQYKFFELHGEQLAGRRGRFSEICKHGMEVSRQAVVDMHCYYRLTG